MSDISPIRAEIKADFTKASTELAQGVRHGSGAILEAILGGRLAKVRADSQRATAQAEVDSQLIKAGLARQEGGNMVYLADAASCARFLVNSRDQRRMENLSACLEEVADAIDIDPTFSLPGKDIDLDFLDDWQEKAERTNSRYMRKLWGRILKGELQQPGKYPRRILGILRNLTAEEAESFTKLARYAAGGIIALPEDEYKKISINPSLLYDSGLFSSPIPMGKSFFYDNKSIACISAADCCLALHFSKPLSGEIKTLSGYALSMSGISLLQLPDIEKLTADHLEKIFFVIKRNMNQIMRISAHPWTDASCTSIIPNAVLCQYPD